METSTKVTGQGMSDQERRDRAWCGWVSPGRLESGEAT